MVQLREKDLPGGVLLKLASRLKETVASRALLVVNERADVTLACGADGVQLGEEGLPVAAVRRLVGADLLIGRSVHSVESALRAEAEGADFLIAGAIFPTGSHSQAEPAGVGLLSRIAPRVRIPVLGIGGIGHHNVAQVIEAGAHGAAVISAILSAEHPEEAASRLLAQMTSAWRSLETEGRTV